MSELRIDQSYEKVEEDPFTPDRLVSEIFRLQTELDPQWDAGDMTIHIQDDTPLVEVVLNGFGRNKYLAFGGSLVDALERARQYYLDPQVKATIDEIHTDNAGYEAPLLPPPNAD